MKKCQLMKVITGHMVDNDIFEQTLEKLPAETTVMPD